MKTHCAKAVLRSASTPSRGWGSSDKNPDSRRTREARSLMPALFRLLVWNAIRRNTAKQGERPYIDHLNDAEQNVDRSFEWSSCYRDHSRDSLDHRRDEFNDIASFRKLEIGWISGWRTRMRCDASGFMQTLLVRANSEYPAGEGK